MLGSREAVIVSIRSSFNMKGFLHGEQQHTQPTDEPNGGKNDPLRDQESKREPCLLVGTNATESWLDHTTHGNSKAHFFPGVIALSMKSAE